MKRPSGEAIYLFLCVGWLAYALGSAFTHNLQAVWPALAASFLAYLVRRMLKAFAVIEKAAEQVKLAADRLRK